MKEKNLKKLEVVISNAVTVALILMSLVAVIITAG